MDHALEVADDARLVMQARQGASDAFAALYRRHVGPIYRYLLVRVSSREDAEDLTETVFLRAWQSLPALRAEQTFAVWLYRIARNAVIDHYRTRKRHLPLEAEAAQSLATDAPEVDDDIDAVRTALSALPDEQREVVALRFVEGLSHEEVAQAIGKSEGACRVIQHRALKAISRVLSRRK